MGNFSSCTTGLGFNSAADQLPAASSSPQLAAPASLHAGAARVLLIDGSMLKFRAPIKVMKLLLDYPNHLICPLDSLKPGLHSLSSLLPHEKLQLGRLYLLLPFKGTMQAQESCCIKSKQAVRQTQVLQNQDQFLEADMQERRTRLLRGAPTSHVGFASCASFYKKEDVGGRLDHHNINKLQSCGALVQEEQQYVSTKKKAGSRDVGKWQQKSRVNMIKSEVGHQDCAEGRKNGDVGRQHSYRRRSAAPSSSNGGKLSECKASRRGSMRMRYGSGAGAGGKESSDVNVRPLCDTPELQRAYRSFLLRRSSSWTPRLPPILERRS